MTSVLFLVGIALLIGGAELLVRGATRLALSSGISSLVVGLTVVALGTSSPELAVTIQSSLAGTPDLAVGNVVGSNIANILLILGLAALITPLTVAQGLIRLDVPIMIGCAILVLALALDGIIGRLDGLLLVIGMLSYLSFAVIQSRRESRQVAAEYDEAYGPPERATWQQLAVNLALIMLGLVLLVQGADWIVDGAVTFAEALGLSKLIVGLTIVAVGTSLPEIAATVAASLKGERDIAVGNVVGSCILNILAVLGIGALVAPAGIPVAAAALTFDIPVMIAAMLACLPIFLNGHTIWRWEGGLFFGYYLAYTAYVVLAAMGNVEQLRVFAWAMGLFVLPLTSITLIVLLVRSLRGMRQAQGTTEHITKHTSETR